jgi:nitric oxide reductase NorQ protein
MNMKVIGYQATSSVSKMNKQYTILVLENGHMIRHWGVRKNQNGKTISASGSVRVEKVGMTPANLYGVLQKEFADRQSKSDYDGLTYEFSGMEYPDLKVGATDLEVKTEARKLASAWLDSVERTNTNQFEVALNRFSDLNSHRRSIEDFAKGSSGVSPTITLPQKTAKVPAAKTRSYFTDIKEIAEGKKVLRPNGEEYKPREVMGHTDVSLLRKFREISMFVRLSGPPGAGKTALVEAAFGDELITVTGHGDMTVANFVGSHMPLPDGTWKWQDGPLIKAMKEGKPFFIDEGTRIPAEALNIVFSAMDGRNMVRLDDRPDDPIVYGAKGFYVVMGYNPDTLGARPLDEALTSRFKIQIEVKTDPVTAKGLGVPAVVIRIAANLAKRDEEDRKQGSQGYWVPQMREMLTFRDLVKVGAGEDFALATLVASCPKPMDLPTVVQVIKDVAKVDTLDIPQLGGLV